MTRATQLTDVVTVHGEGPVYSSRWAGIRWVDMLAGEILELQPNGGVDRARYGAVAAVFRPRRTPGMIVAIERGLAMTDGDDLHAPVVAREPLWTDSNLRMNEGGCSPDGRFFAGSVTYDHEAGAATLYSFGHDLVPVTVVDHVTVSNGIEWSPDETRVYYVDSTTLRIDVFDWDAGRGLHNRRPFTSVEGGEPDGLTVDAEGGVWVAVWGGSAVHRYAPSGELSEVIEVPARQVSALTFGGENLDELYITTSRKGLGDGAEPGAGALFVAQPGVSGMPVREFAG